MRRWIRRLTRTLLTLLACTLVLLLLLAGKVEASEGIRGDRCVVAIDEHIAEDFYFLCRRLDVFGRIDGDLIGAAVEVTLWPTSSVRGDVWIGGGKLEVAGQVSDDIHFGGITVAVRDEADFSRQDVDLATVALNAQIDQGARLTGDLLVYSYQTQIDGVVGGSVDFSGEALIINGTVEGQVDASVGDARRNNDLPALPFWDVNFHDPGLKFGEEALIKGDLDYRSASASLVAPEVVEGSYTFTLTGHSVDITKAQPNEAARIVVNYLGNAFYDVITLLIVGLLVLRLLPRAVRQPASHVRQHIVSAVGWGLVTFMFSVPVAIAILLLGLILLLILYLFNLVGLMMLITVLLMVAGSGLLGGFYFLLYFMGRVVISFLIGQWMERYVLHLPEWGKMRQWVFTLVIGTVIYALISNLPLPAVGLIFELVTALAGGGAVIMTLRDAVSESGLFAPRLTPVIVTASDLAPVVTPRGEPVKETAPPPGMENLPPGFTGFDENW